MKEQEIGFSIVLNALILKIVLSHYSNNNKESILLIFLNKWKPFPPNIVSVVPGFIGERYILITYKYIIPKINNIKPKKKLFK